MRVVLLADHPELIPAVAALRHREWGRAPEPEDPRWWLAMARREAGRDDLPVTFAAVDAGGQLTGAVGLGAFDLPELATTGRTPWVLGMVVRPDQRGTGTGRALLAHLERAAAARGHHEVWVATEQAAAFYQRCGWHPVERATLAGGEVTTVLRRPLTGRPPGGGS
jgi:GNAT superfamily N-acetyltransferase